MIILPAGALPAVYARQARVGDPGPGLARLAAPAAFNKVGPANGLTGQPLTVTLEWTASPDATSYEYCYDTTNNDNCSGWTSTTSTSVVTPALAEYQPYYWHVRAVNATGTTYSDASTVFWSFTTGGKPQAFSKTLPANNATGQPLSPSLTWTPSTNVTSYEYCLDTVNNGSCDMVGGWADIGDVTSYQPGPLSPATNYYWHVRANNAFGTTYSGAGATAFRLFTTIGPPGAFGKTAPLSGATGQSYPNLTLTWGASTEAASYEYCIDTVDNNACDAAWTSTGTTLSASLTNLNPGTTYYWQVRAVNAVDITYADGATFWPFTTGSPPGAFGKTAPTDGANNQLLNTSLTWGASSGATGYQYCIDTTNNNACDASWVSTGTARTASPSLNAGVTYYWQVRASNTFGTTYAGGVDTLYWGFSTGPAPGTFSKTSPSNGALNQLPALDLVWDTSTNAATYEYCYDTTNDDACTSWISTTATTVPLSGLTPGATYYWHVRAVNAYGTTYSNGFAVNDWPFTIGSAPGTFGKSTPGNGATGQPLSLDLTWTSSAGVSFYEYCLDTVNNGACDTSWASVNAATTAPVGPLSENTPYYWQVRAVNDFGTTYANGAENAFRNFVTGTLPAVFSRSAPSNGATGVGPAPDLVWGSSSGATSYEYCLDTTSGGTCDTSWINVGNVTTTPVGPLNPSTTYYWHVRAVNSTGVTYAGNAPANFFSFITDSLPGPFGKSTPANGAINQLPTVSLTWGASASAASYEYCIDTSNNDTCNTGWVNVGTNLSASPALTAGTVYYWHVRAVNGFGTTLSDASPAFWVFTVGSAPGSFGKSSPTSGATNQLPTVSLSWSTSNGAAGYEYCIDTNNNSACDGTWISTGTSTTVAPPGLVAGTTYYWQVRANNVYGTTYAGGPAAFWSFTIGPAPDAFGKTSPLAGAMDQSINPTLQWSSSANFTRYEYCYDTSNNGVCDDIWRNAGSLTSVSLPTLLENTLYSWQVRAVNVYGITYANGSETAFRAFTTGTLPAAFNKTSPANNATNRPISLNLTWGTSAGAAEYFYCLGLSTALCDANWISTGTQTSALVSLNPSTTYYWHVRATNNAGTTYSGPTPGPAAFFTFTTGTPPGAFGKNLPANGAVNRSLTPTLSWGTSTGVSNYFYCYDTIDNGLCDANWINVGINTSDIITAPLSTGTTYFWHVRAQNSFGTTYSDGASTAWWSFTTGSPPPAFDKTAPASGANNQSLNPTLQWQASTGANSYAYCYDTTNDGSCTGWSNVGNTTTTTVGPLAAATTYYWHIRALNSFGTTYSGPNPGTSAFWSFTTGPAPGLFARTAPANGETRISLSPDLTWAASADAARYEYCYSPSNTVTVATCSPWTNVGLNTTASLSGLSQYTTYYWHVRAVNEFGTTYADNSTSFRSFTTGGKPKAFFKKSPPNSLDIARSLNTSVTWGASANAVTYEYCLATSKAACTNWKPVGNVRSVVPGGLSPSTIYFWHVRAVNEFGVTYSNGSSTAFWTFITGAVCPSITGWKGQYWRNEALTGPAVFCGDEPALFLRRDFGYAVPAPKIPKDHFSARWTRTVNFPTGGLYRFSVDHDDGARLYIDGVLKGKWWDTCCKVDSVNVTLTPGKHTLRLDYHEVAGAANIYIWWEQLNAQFISIASQDGWVLESTEISGVGGSINASSTTFSLGDDAADRQYRSILSFNTSGLPDDAVITSAILKIKGAGLVGTSPFNTHGNILGDVRMGAFSASALLQAGDFQAGSSRDGILTFTNTPSNGWYSAGFTSLGLGKINRMGSTQIRLRFQLDDNDDRSADYMRFYSGNYSTASSRPVLIIVFYRPAGAGR